MWEAGSDLHGVVAVMAALPARAKSLFMRAEVAEAAGELHEALKLYDQGVREASSKLRGASGDTSSAIAAVDGCVGSDLDGRAAVISVGALVVICTGGRQSLLLILLPSVLSLIHVVHFGVVGTGTSGERWC